MKFIIPTILGALTVALAMPCECLPLLTSPLCRTFLLSILIYLNVLIFIPLLS